jgi:hypothetical protein
MAWRGSAAKQAVLVPQSYPGGAGLGVAGFF